MEAKLIFDTAKSIALLLKSIIDLLSNVPINHKSENHMIELYIILEEYIVVKKDFIKFINILLNKQYEKDSLNNVIWQGEKLSKLMAIKNYNLYTKMRYLGSQVKIYNKDLYQDTESYFHKVRGSLIRASRTQYILDTTSYKSLFRSEHIKRKYFIMMYQFKYINEEFYIGKFNINDNKFIEFIDYHKDSEDLFDNLLLNIEKQVKDNYQKST